MPPCRLAIVQLLLLPSVDNRSTWMHTSQRTTIPPFTLRLLFSSQHAFYYSWMIVLNAPYLFGDWCIGDSCDCSVLLVISLTGEWNGMRLDGWSCRAMRISKMQGTLLFVAVFCRRFIFLHRFSLLYPNYTANVIVHSAYCLLTAFLWRRWIKWYSEVTGTTIKR